MKLYCATTNPGKLREFELAIRTYGGGAITVEPLPQLKDLPAAEETGATFEDNAVQKALHYATYSDGFVFVDDSGLAVDALQGSPGVHSARYAGEGATDSANNEKLMAAMNGQADRTAEFVCVVALAQQGRVVGTFAGVVQGELLEAPRGAEGFGYDPLFYYPPKQRTFAELSSEDKLSESHRGRALKLMVEYLQSL